MRTAGNCAEVVPNLLLVPFSLHGPLQQLLRGHLIIMAIA
jgi:hypothetical protein